MFIYILSDACCDLFSECGSVQALLFLAFLFAFYLYWERTGIVLFVSWDTPYSPPSLLSLLSSLTCVTTLLPHSCYYSPASLLSLLSSLTLVNTLLPHSCHYSPPSLLSLLSSLTLVTTLLPHSCHYSPPSLLSLPAFIFFCFHTMFHTTYSWERDSVSKQASLQYQISICRVDSFRLNELCFCWHS